MSKHRESAPFSRDAIPLAKRKLPALEAARIERDKKSLTKLAAERTRFLSVDQQRALDALPKGKDNASLLAELWPRPFGLTKLRRLVWQLQSLGLVGWRACGTYGDFTGFTGRYKAWYRK